MIKQTVSASRIALALLLLAAFGFLVFRVFSTYVPRSRMMASNLYEAAQPLRADVQEYAMNHGTLHGVAQSMRVPTTIKTDQGSATLALSDAGSILLRSNNLELRIELVPAFENGAITWECHGAPERDMPLPCRPQGKRDDSQGQ